MRQSFLKPVGQSATEGDGDEYHDEGFYYFGVKVEPEEEFDMKMSPVIRKDVGYGELKLLKTIE